MKIIKKALIGLQILLVALGFVAMINLIGDQATLTLPAKFYEERIYLAHLLNATQVLTLFVAAIAIDPIINRIHGKKENEIPEKDKPEEPQ